MFSFSWNILGDLSFEQLHKYVGVFLPELNDKPRSERKRLLREYLQDADLTPFKEHFAAELLRITGLEKAIPDAYAEFRPVLVDSIRYLLSNIKADRLKDICIEQLLLPPTAGSEERLFHLAACLPTLYKLGQIVARNRHLDPHLRSWLERLETGYITADLPTLFRTLDQSLAPFRTDYEWQLESDLLSEASVGAVIGLQWRRRGEREYQRGVVKLLKPGVRENLDEELSLLDRLGAFLEGRRDQYGLAEFPFRGTTGDIAEALRRETDFSQEQRHLREARRTIGKATGTLIPDLLPFCTDRVTAMQRIEGRTLSLEAHSGPERAHLAESLFRAVFVQTLFSEDPTPLFHGDLHAGNMMTVRNGAAEMPGLALIDWSQAGRLTRAQRGHITAAAIGLYLKSPERLSNAFLALSEPGHSDDATTHMIIRRVVADELESARPAQRPVIRRLFIICDALIREGVKFPGDLLLFRKTVFSFFDVVTSLLPLFDADLCLLKHLAPMIGREIGPRWIEALAPGIVGDSGYRSLISTPDLWTIGTSTALAAWRRQMIASCVWWSNACLGPVPPATGSTNH